VPSEKWFDVDVESMSNQPEFVTKIDKISMIDVDSTSIRLSISLWGEPPCVPVALPVAWD
jgi:hypothetical protein